VWVVFTRGDLGLRYRDFLLEPDQRLEQILLKHARRGHFVARPEPGKGVDCLIVSPEDMVELEVVEFVLPICSHAGVTTVGLSHDLIDNELRVSADVNPLNPKFDGDAQTIDQCLILRHIVCGVEV
jgi:hypothetical protein